MEELKVNFLVRKWKKTGLLENAKKASRAEYLALELELASRQDIA